MKVKQILYTLWRNLSLFWIVVIFTTFISGWSIFWGMYFDWMDVSYRYSHSSVFDVVAKKTPIVFIEELSFRYFPFMIVCILLPLIKGRRRKVAVLSSIIFIVLMQIYFGYIY